jgi:hypothetical protein
MLTLAKIRWFWVFLVLWMAVPFLLMLRNLAATPVVGVLYGEFNISLLAETVEHGRETSIQNAGSAISRAFMSGVLYATPRVLMYTKQGG